MKTNIRGDKIEITKSIRTHIEDKLERLDRYFENPEEVAANVIARVHNRDQVIEITIPTNVYTLRAEEKHSDLYAAVDLVIDKLEGQIRKNKTKLKKRYKTSPIQDFLLDFDENIEEEEKIVKRKNIDMKPMDEEEALLQMELLNHDFFVFKNIDENCISVLYKRKNGGFGIINTK